jgi:hypothetical protein
MDRDAAPQRTGPVQAGTDAATIAGTVADPETGAVADPEHDRDLGT